MSNTVCSASGLVEDHFREAYQVRQKERDEALTDLGVTPQSTKATPKSRLAQMRKVVCLEEMKSTMEKRARLMLLANVIGSYGSVRSGLMLWHHFAVDVSKYCLAQTLPPGNDSDVCIDLNLFSHHGTASNYISYLRFGCLMADVPKSHRDTDKLRRTLAGLGKLHGGPLRVKLLLQQAHVMGLIAFF